MKVFVVFQEGVYRHKCAGVFSSLELATRAAFNAIQQELDDYHDYGVIELAMDTEGSHEVTRLRLHREGKLITKEDQL